MPSWVSQHSEPVRKRLLVEKRLRRLRAAIKQGESMIRISREAENLRLATLSLIKAKRALIREYPRRDPDGRHAWNLQDEEQRWLSISTESIVDLHKNDDTSRQSVSDTVEKETPR
jgi:hypothetical protein